MQRNYEKQKIIIAYQLRLASFGQQLTPRMVNRLILDISQDIRNYKMYFKKEFIDYFDIVQIAVEVFYRLLMEDILRLCDIHPVNQQHQDIDYLMIALAYRLTTFDQDPTWEHYLTLEGQIWRPAFLKHSLVWISSLHRNLQNLICKALQDDTWTGLHVDDSFTFVSAESTGSQSLRRSQQGSRPREIPSPLTGPSRGITPSHNSAFVQVPGRSASAIEKEFTNKVIIGDTSTSGAVQQSSTANDDVANQPGRSDIEVPKETNKTESSETTRPKIPSKSSTSNLLKYVQSTQYLASSHASLSSDSVYTDARSNTSDVEDYTSCNEDEENEQVLETSHLGHITVPISSSLVDTLSGVNRLIDVVRHFLHLLCPKKTSTRCDSLRMSPEDGNEIYEKLEQGRVDMVKMLGDIIESLALFYGYYIISCESCGMNEEVLEPIIGQRCSTRSSTLFQDLGVRPCRHRTAGLQRCNSADSQGNCATSCVSMSRIENNTSQSERVVEEMCVRLNNVRTMKNLLTTLIENAVQNVLFSSPDVECNLMSVSDMSNTWSSVASTSHENNPPSSPASLNAMPTDVIDKNSIERTLEELQEIEDGLVKIMAYRANDVIKKLLQLLLSLNLRSFNARKRLRPVLNATRKTLHMLSSNLYPDCYAAVLRHFWLAIVEDFAEEKDKLIFLSVTAMEQAKLQLEAISYFIEIFRAEEDSIPLAFVSTTIEPIQKTLNHYTLPTANLRTMYEALEQRNASAVRISDSLSTRYRYQRPPSGILIQRLRIELHSENPHFSGQRFVECVSDRIRLEGNLSLGVCAVPDGGDEASGKALGEYLLHEEILVYVGKLVAETENESDDELDAEVGRYAPERGIIIPGGRKRPKIFNGVYIFGPESAETRSSLSADGLKSDNKIITREEGDTPQHFCDSENVLYKFKSSDFEESLCSLDPENYIDQGDNDDQKDIITVLFTRRNIERDAKTFLDTHETTCVVEELQDKIKRNTTNCCWPSAPLLPVN
ncbi:uncharacterized protein LOC114516081 isoform X2 [Dendronephthya gigantea]|nr:uncharacterized protein LOC114516081 isoform X2 [Dendronephthya gigantea]